MSRPAWKRLTRSLVTAATRFTLPSVTLPTQTTPEPRRSRSVSATERRPSASRPSIRPVTTATPLICRAAAISSSARERASLASSSANCFASTRCSSSNLASRFGTSSGAILRISAASRSAASFRATVSSAALHLGTVREVEAQMVGGDQRAGLRHMGAEHAAERGVQQVRARVVLAQPLPPRRLDAHRDILPLVEAAQHDAYAVDDELRAAIVRVEALAAAGAPGDR